MDDTGGGPWETGLVDIWGTQKEYQNGPNLGHRTSLRRNPGQKSAGKCPELVFPDYSLFGMATPDSLCTRRGFLCAAPFLPMAVTAALGLRPTTAQASEPVQRRGGPLMKPALNAYSFNSRMVGGPKKRTEGLTMFDLLDFCAEHGLEGLDATGYYFPGYPEVPPDDFLHAFRRRAYELGIGIVGTGTRNEFVTADKAHRAEGVQHIKRWVEVAARLGVPVLRVFADHMIRNESWKKAVPDVAHADVQAWVADDLRECAEHGRKHGVIIGVQNHGDFNGSAADFLGLLKRVGSDWCAPVLDTGYFNTPDPYEDIAQVAPYAVNWIVKQSVFDGGYGSEPIDLGRLAGIMRANGYRGYLSIETLGAKGRPYDPYAVVPAFVQQIRAAVAAPAPRA